MQMEREKPILMTPVKLLKTCILYIELNLLRSYIGIANNKWAFQDLILPNSFELWS